MPAHKTAYPRCQNNGSAPSQERLLGFNGYFKEFLNRERLVEELPDCIRAVLLKTLQRGKIYVFTVEAVSATKTRIKDRPTARIVNFQIGELVPEVDASRPQEAKGACDFGAYI
jgi:hypothetical protein